jgi:hypothetical protein
VLGVVFLQRDLQHKDNSMATTGRNDIIVVVGNEVHEHGTGRYRPDH